MKLFSVCVHGTVSGDSDYYEHLGIFKTSEEAKKAIAVHYNKEKGIDINDYEADELDEYYEDVEEYHGIKASDVKIYGLEASHDENHYFYEIDGYDL